jgi:hypothetical protein
MQTESNLVCNPQIEQVTASPELIFSSGLTSSGLPARGLLGSLLVHLLFAGLGFYLPWSYWIPSTARLVTTESMLQQHEVLLLPDLHPASDSGSGSPNSRPEKPSLASSSATIAAKGVAYKGDQLIVSTPPHPDNFIQTIRQPDLVSPPKLPRPLPFPSMIMMAPAVTLPTAAMPQLPAVTDRHIQAPHPVDALTIPPPVLPPQIESPKLTLPTLQSGPAPTVATTVAKAAVPAAVPQYINLTGAGGSDARNILIADAVEVPARAVLPVPPGELYGAFTVSPVPIPSSGANSPGSAGGNATSGSGTGTAIGTGTGTGDRAGTLGTGPGHEGGGGTLAGNGHGSGSGTGTGSGHGAGTAAGTGHGNGVGNGNSPFPDIMIQGGTGSSTRGGAPASAGTSPRQGSYGITIVANGASGGGFKDFGVFRNEAAYTVYIDMSEAGTNGPNWTLQYALDSHPTPNAIALRSHSLLLPPFATTRLVPHFSADAAMRNLGSLIVVFGVINSHGNFEGLRILQSPDASFNKALLDSLERWVFRPAEVEGNPVSVKILLGVPVSSVPQEHRSASVGSAQGQRP